MILTPILQRFSRNPVRTLRIPSDASMASALVAAERAQTLCRMGFSPQGEELLPWLPRPDIYDTQKALSEIEAPLVRLIEQAFWFDLARDPDPNGLMRSLASPQETFSNPYPAPPTELPAEDGELSPNDRVRSVATWLNQANSLLLCASAVSGGFVLGPIADLGPALADHAWTKIKGGKQGFEDPHRFLESRPDQGLWEKAFERWSVVLKHPWLNEYFGACIQVLDDDSITIEEAPDVIESVRTRLADLGALEAKFFLEEGQFDVVAEIVQGIEHLELGARARTMTLRPLNKAFEAQTDAINTDFEKAGENDSAAVQTQILRIEELRERWSVIDPHHQLGLDQYLDSSVEAAFGFVRGQKYSYSVTQSLFERLADLAFASSLSERIKAQQKKHEEMKDWDACVFCGEHEPEAESSVVLKGKKETSTNSDGVMTVHHYAILFRLIPRCQRCARLHGFIQQLGRFFILLTFGACLPLFIDFPEIGFVLFFGGFGYLMMCVRVANFNYWVSILVGEVLRTGQSQITARFFTPRSHKRYGQYRLTEQYRELRREKCSVAPDFRSNAWAKVK